MDLSRGTRVFLPSLKCRLPDGVRHAYEMWNFVASNGALRLLEQN